MKSIFGHVRGHMTHPCHGSWQWQLVQQTALAVLGPELWAVWGAPLGPWFGPQLCSGLKRLKYSSSVRGLCVWEGLSSVSLCWGYSRTSACWILCKKRRVLLSPLTWSTSFKRNWTWWNWWTMVCKHRFLETTSKQEMKRNREIRHWYYTLRTVMKQTSDMMKEERGKEREW